MKLELHEREGTCVAIVRSDGVVIGNVQDALDLMATVRHNHECDKMMLFMQNINPDFFELRTGLAGEVLQKYTNYGVQLAIVGDFSKFESKALRDFIRESNRGEQVFFLPNEQAALDALNSV